ncbi:bicarbonate transport ATP-binding protein CmpC [Abditibacteriota bacterium]|nr:bicarbonate transport ATP-binding protein CmpC [Abditibacteriota bacterium]
MNAVEASSTPILRVENVSKTYKGRKGDTLALEPTTFSIAQGEFVAIVGPSGCGKSTLLHIIGGLIEPSSGQMFLDGQEFFEAGAERGMVFQGYTLFPWLSVRENVKFGPRMQGLPLEEQESRASHFLNEVNLHGFHNHCPKQLSGGMRQRVAIARALANKPRILLMDEPFGALDAQTRAVMQDLVLGIRKREKTTALLITHDIDEAVYLADRIFVMTARPGRFKAEIVVPFGQDRTEAVRDTSEFFELRKQVSHLLHDEGRKVVEAELATARIREG